MFTTEYVALANDCTLLAPVIPEVLGNGFTVTLILAVVVLYWVVSVGVKVTLWEDVPTLGVVEEVVHVNVPDTFAPAALVAAVLVEPDGVNVELASELPKQIALAVGEFVITGVCLVTVSDVLLSTGEAEMFRLTLPPYW